VKITVIATGFRDQMPERRARMLNVEEVPVVAVPVVSSGNWMREQEPQAAPAAPRFLSETEDETENAEEPIFFASAAPGVATTVTVAAAPATANDYAKEYGVERESVSAAAESRPSIVEAAVEAKPAPRDYASEFTESQRSVKEPDESTQGGPALFAEPGAAQDRDLDVPTFLRRLHF
jgi:cell division protein FtsZ